MSPDTPGVDLAKRLLSQQAPHLAPLDVRPSPTSGSSNWVFRVGEHLAMRMPRSGDDEGDLAKELAWLPTLAGGIATPIPRVEFVGAASELFPHAWAVVTWVEGHTPTGLDTAAQSNLADGLGEFTRELHAIDTQGLAGGAERWGYRCGEPVTQTTDEWVEEAAGDLADLFDPAQVKAAWRLIRDVAPLSGSPVWVHTDLSAENVLVDADGHLSGVIDFGGLGIGDPAIDLLYAWDLFDPSARQTFARAAGADDAAWARARAWAFSGPGLLTLAHYRDTMPERAARLTRMLEAIADEVGVRLR